MLYQVYLVIKQIMDYTLHQRRKNRRMEFPNKWIYRSSSSEEDEMSLSSSAKITTPITKTITPLKSNKATEMDVLIDLPHPFGILPALKFKNDRGCNMDHVYMKRDFLNFIESEELHANSYHSQVLKYHRNTTNRGPIQKFDKNDHCMECFQCKDTCHNILYGQYCIDACVRYEKHCDLKSCKLTFKKVFINYYNNALELNQFRKNGHLPDAHNKWTFPPPCMKRCSYDFVLNWRTWNANGGWLTAKDNVPNSFKNL